MSNGTTETKRDGWEKWQIIAGVVGQLIIPIIVAVLAWYLPYYQDRQKEINVELKTMDIFYKVIGSSDSTQQNMAAGVLKMVKPAFAAKLTKTLSGLNTESKLSLSEAIVTDSTQPSAVRIEAHRVLTNLTTDKTQQPSVRMRANDIIRTAPR
jgi:hypothetical protein